MCRRSSRGAHPPRAQAYGVFRISRQDEHPQRVTYSPRISRRGRPSPASTRRIGLAPARLSGATRCASDSFAHLLTYLLHHAQRAVPSPVMVSEAFSSAWSACTACWWSLGWHSFASSSGSASAVGAPHPQRAGRERVCASAASAGSRRRRLAPAVSSVPSASAPRRRSASLQAFASGGIFGSERRAALVPGGAERHALSRRTRRSVPRGRVAAGVLGTPRQRRRGSPLARRSAAAIEVWRCAPRPSGAARARFLPIFASTETWTASAAARAASSRAAARAARSAASPEGPSASARGRVLHPGDARCAGATGTGAAGATSRPRGACSSPTRRCWTARHLCRTSICYNCCGGGNVKLSRRSAGVTGAGAGPRRNLCA